MRIASISDLHGNDTALRAVLDDIARVGADRVVCLGDVATLGPSPCETLGMIRDLGCACIMGNHDVFMLDPALIHAYTKVPVVIEAVDWCRARLSADEIEYVRTFQPHLEIAIDDRTTLFAFHGSPGSNTQDILATTPPEKLDELLAGHSAAIMTGGHTHLQMLRQHRGMLLVNPGSVGLPFKEYVAGAAPTLLGHAEYAIVEAQGGTAGVTLRRVPVDGARSRARVTASDNPLRPMLLQQYA